MVDGGSVLSDALIDSIIREPKYIGRRVNLEDMSFSEKGSNLIKKVRLECEGYECFMLIRQSVDRPSNFSVILVYSDFDKNDKVVLRFNGNHGKHRNRIEGDVVHGPHIHKMTERYQRRTSHPDGYAVSTDSNNDLDGAIREFLKMANISFRRGVADRKDDMEG